jgi:hypothetical protein
MTKHFDKVYYAGFDFNTRSHDHYFETKLKNMTCHNMADEARVIQVRDYIPTNPHPHPLRDLTLDGGVGAWQRPHCRVKCTTASVHFTTPPPHPTAPSHGALCALPHALLVVWHNSQNA